MAVYDKSTDTHYNSEKNTHTLVYTAVKWILLSKYHWLFVPHQHNYPELEDFETISLSFS